MPRQKRHRFVHREPPISVYKPAGIPLKELDEILITLDEYEAIRLADFKGMNQREACSVMHISQPTFHRILASARHKIAKGIVEGHALRIEGGRYILADGSGGFQCTGCGTRLDMQKDDGRPCPNCGSKRIRWQRWNRP